MVMEDLELEIVWGVGVCVCVCVCGPACVPVCVLEGWEELTLSESQLTHKTDPMAPGRKTDIPG